MSDETTDPTARPASTPAPVAVPEDRSTVFGRAAEKLRADVPMSAEVRSAVAKWLEAVAVTWAGAEQHHDYDDGPIEFEETIDGLAQDVADAVLSPRPEPVVAPLPSEAVKAAALALVQYESSGMCKPGEACSMCDCAMQAATPEQLDEDRRRNLDRAGHVLTAALPHLRPVPEDDEDTVRVPRDSLTAMLHAQRDWSTETFGPGARLAGVLAHIRSELDEVEDAPQDVEEWIDVVILALDGAWRAGHEPEVIVDALLAKYAKNRARSWPDWRTADPDAPIEHVR